MMLEALASVPSTGDEGEAEEHGDVVFALAVDGLADEGREYEFFYSLSLGLRAPLTQHFSLRLETRSYLTPINTHTAPFCRSDQGGVLCRSDQGGALCQVRARGSPLFQGDFPAGATYSF
jgi:hypothetical protein